MRIVLTALCLAGCSSAAPPAATQIERSAVVAPSMANVAAPLVRRTAPRPAIQTPSITPYVGRWTGVEGTYLVVAERAGGVTLDMQYDLDHKGRFVGAVTDAGIRFTRNGVVETARRTDGGATGLKYLAGKSHCLTVTSGEGYCR